MLQDAIAQPLERKPIGAVKHFTWINMANYQILYFLKHVRQIFIMTRLIHEPTISCLSIATCKDYTSPPSLILVCSHSHIPSPWHVPLAVCIGGVQLSAGPKFLKICTNGLGAEPSREKVIGESYMMEQPLLALAGIHTPSSQVPQGAGAEEHKPLAQLSSTSSAASCSCVSTQSMHRTCFRVRNPWLLQIYIFCGTCVLHIFFVKLLEGSPDRLCQGFGRFLRDKHMTCKPMV